MKRIVFVVFLVIFGSMGLKAQITFNVSPGIVSGGTFVGYKIDNLVPYIGLQYLGASTTYERSGIRYTYPDTVMRPYTEKNEMSGNIYMPQVGVKYFIKDLKDIKLYLNGCFSYAILSASSKNDGVEDKDIQNTVDNVSVWGLELGVGTEYFFSKNFSLGGEFDLRMFFAGSDYSEPTTIYTPSGQSMASTVHYKYNMNLGVTNSKITLNYYFND